MLTVVKSTQKCNSSESKDNQWKLYSYIKVQVSDQKHTWVKVKKYYKLYSSIKKVEVYTEICLKGEN